jgi:hypothetical protein
MVSATVCNMDAILLNYAVLNQELLLNNFVELQWAILVWGKSFSKWRLR